MEVQEWVMALMVFGAVALAVGAAALLWEGFQAFRRQQAATRALQRVHGEEKDPGVQDRESILRKRQEEEIGGVVGFLLARLPHQADLQQRLEQSGVKWSAATFLLLSLGCAAALGLAAAIVVQPLMAVVAGAIGLILPWLYLARKRTQRIEAFEEVFPEALDLMTRSIRAGHAFATGVQVVAEESEEPVRAEFKQVHEETRFGLPLDESLMGLADRIDLVDVRLFVTSILIQREAGGNLAEKLDSLSRIIRARFKFRRQVKIHTAHGRMTGTVIGVAPLVAGVLLYLVNPDYMEPLVFEPAGRLMLFAAFIMMLIGFFFIRRITDIQY